MTKLCRFNQDNRQFSAFERPAEQATSRLSTLRRITHPNYPDLNPLECHV